MSLSALINQIEGQELGSIRPISQSVLYATIWAEYGICTVVMVLRAYSQLFMLRKFTLDDFVMVGAYILQGVASALVTVSTYYGLGSNIAALDYGQLVGLLKYVMIGMPFGVLAPLAGRISFILLLLATVLSVHNMRRKLLWALIILQVIVNIIPCVLQYTQCSPVEGLWNPKIVLTECQGAILVQRWGYFQGAFNALTDLILIITGLAVVLKLKVHRWRKIILGLILSLSLLAMVAAILRTIQIYRLSSLQFSHSLALWAIWFLTEGTVVIVTASAPRIRAICVLRQKNKRSYNAHLTSNSGDKAPAQGKRQELNLGRPQASKHRPFRTKYSGSDLDRPLVYHERKSRDVPLGDPESLNALPVEPNMELTALPQVVKKRSVL
ncbi:hypothetical protein BDW67DRAFT_184300 [Aspergillus spinulosporus]